MKLKTSKLDLRLDEEVKRKFQIAAKLKGATASGLLHMYIVRVIREEEAANPHAFIEELSPEALAIPVERENTRKRKA